MNKASGFAGVSTPTASAVTGQPVSHCTEEPNRLAPQKTTWSIVNSASRLSIAARRLAISPAEKRGYSASRIACKCGGSAKSRSGPAAAFPAIVSIAIPAPSPAH
jgi:hypothetical protein